MTKELLEELKKAEIDFSNKIEPLFSFSTENVEGILGKRYLTLKTEKTIMFIDFFEGRIGITTKCVGTKHYFF